MSRYPLRAWLVRLVALCILAGPVSAQTAYPDMASEPDPTSFVKRTDTSLTLLGVPLRFGGADLNWLGLRLDAGMPPRRPTTYEVTDALQTLRALGGTVVRSGTLAGTAGCDLCLEPTEGKYSPEAFAALDQSIKVAGDLGMRLILPLAGGTGDCAKGGEAGDAICAYLGWHGLTDRAAFFTDPAIRTALLARVHALLTHINSLTGIAYRDDPAILAWENCESCGEGNDPAAVSAWTEALGQAIKAEDRFHLYENGAFAGRISPKSAHPVGAAAFATPSVDIVGDHGLPPGDEATMIATLSAVTSVVKQAGRVYVLDGFDWGPRLFKTEADLETYLTAIFQARDVAGALVQGLQGHADRGGYLPPPAASARDGTALYFPGRTTADVAQDDMVLRARALRRFEFDMADVTLAPAYLLTPKPEIISVKHGRVIWRGAAGAANYTIERSPDPSIPYSWTVVCDQCATDAAGFWQDPSPPGGTAWYRIMPFNINGHKAVPSAPVAASNDGKS
jgi:hypothetical protein